MSTRFPSQFLPCFRWYGPNDPVTLDDIRQAGALGIVTSLHQIPVGDIWSQKDILLRKQIIEETYMNRTPLTWEVVESLPVHDEIKRGTPESNRYIDNYCKSLEHLGRAGIRVVCYNFMPVLDWVRTDLSFEMPNRARTLRFEYELLVVFDRYILKRAHAKQAYSEEIWNKAEQRYSQMQSDEIEQLRNTFLLALPGDSVQFSLEGLKRGIENYRMIEREQLRENLLKFLRVVVPVAESAGVKLAIHPDDPPFSVLGLPRIVSSATDIEYILDTIPSVNNGITFCTGSLGAIPDNELLSILDKCEDRIHFLHLRSVSRWGYKNFMEANHLEGDVDQYSIIHTLLQLRIKRLGVDSPHFSLPMRPDHGIQMLDDLHKQFYPGYSTIGRLKGLGELKGLEKALMKIHVKA